MPMYLLIRCLLLSVPMLLAWPVWSAPLPRVASINLCADQLVLLLADNDQILTLTNLSHDSAGSYFYEKARQYSANKGYSEKILKLAPDVVIAGQYTALHTVKLLTEVGLRVETLPIAGNFETLFSNIEQVAGWTGQQARGQAIIADLKQRLQNLKPVTEPRPVAAAYDPNGYTSGAGSLRGQLMELSGWRNAATDAGIESYGQLSLEQIINIAPDALIDSPYSPGTYSRAQMTSQHPALLKAGLDPHIISIPSRMMVCAGPWTVDVLERLQEERIMMTTPQ